MSKKKAYPQIVDIKQHLTDAGIYPTPQRITIAKVLFVDFMHLTADELFDKVKANNVSRATVYNTLKLFSLKKLVREITVDATRTFFDTNTGPHYHFYNVDSGELTDIEDPEIAKHFVQDIPKDMLLEDIDITVRIRNNKNVWAQTL